MLGAIAVIAAGVSGATRSAASDRIESLPGWSGPLPTPQASGYLDAGAGKHLHYWLVESHGNLSGTPSEDPVVFWFNGGPGCSSLDGYFYEHGPLHVKEPIVNSTDGVPELYANPYAWNNIANLVFLESPAGVGFSYADTQDGLKHNDTSTAEDAYAAVVDFLTKYPQFQKNDFFIAGESYAGMYVPTLALQILAHNNAIEEATVSGDVPRPSAIKVNLQGILVGNGVTGAGSIPDDVYLKNDVEFFYGHGLYNNSLHDAIVSECGDFKLPSDKCSELQSVMHAELDGLNVYNLYGPCIMATDVASQPSQLRAPLPKVRESLLAFNGPDGCIDAGAATKYLDHPQVRKAIHVDVPAIGSRPWHICGINGGSYQSNFGSLLPFYKSTLIPKIRVLIFNGDVDMCVPYKGNEWWTESLGLPVEKGWRQWTVDHQVAGYVTTYAQNFQFVTVKGAGHMVPQYRPGPAFAMFQRMLLNEPFDCETSAGGCKISILTKE